MHTHPHRKLREESFRRFHVKVHSAVTVDELDGDLLYDYSSWYLKLHSAVVVDELDGDLLCDYSSWYSCYF